MALHDRHVRASVALHTLHRVPHHAFFRHFLSPHPQHHAVSPNGYAHRPLKKVCGEEDTPLEGTHQPPPFFHFVLVLLDSPTHRPADEGSLVRTADGLSMQLSRSRNFPGAVVAREEGAEKKAEISHRSGRHARRDRLHHHHHPEEEKDCHTVPPGSVLPFRERQEKTKKRRRRGRSHYLVRSSWPRTGENRHRPPRGHFVSGADSDGMWSDAHLARASHPSDWWMETSPPHTPLHPLSPIALFRLLVHRPTVLSRPHPPLSTLHCEKGFPRRERHFLQRKETLVRPGARSGMPLQECRRMVVVVVKRKKKTCLLLPKRAEGEKKMLLV